MYQVNVNNLKVVSIDKECSDWQCDFYKVFIQAKNENYCKDMMVIDGEGYNDSCYVADLSINRDDKTSSTSYHYLSNWEVEFIGEYSNNTFTHWLQEQVEKEFKI